MKPDVSPDMRELTRVDGRSERTRMSFVIPDVRIQPGQLEWTYILTPQQVAERLQVKPSWVYEQTRTRSGVRNSDPLPYIKIGLYLRFDWRDVVAWLERQKMGDHNLDPGASRNSRP
jgi:Helix-turn-helix domain